MAAIYGNVDCFKIPTRKKRATEAWNPSFCQHHAKGRVGRYCLARYRYFAFDALMQRNGTGREVEAHVARAPLLSP